MASSQNTWCTRAWVELAGATTNALRRRLLPFVSRGQQAQAVLGRGHMTGGQMARLIGEERGRDAPADILCQPAAGMERAAVRHVDRRWYLTSQAASLGRDRGIGHRN